VSLITASRLYGRRSQRTFDVLLRTLAEPGRIVELPEDVTHPDIPAILWPALSLGGVDQVVSVDDDVNHPLASLVRDATGSGVGTIRGADLVALTNATPAQIEHVAVGSAFEPEAGARLAIGVRDIHEDKDDGLPLRLAGPGVAGHRNVTVTGLDPKVAARLGTASATFPAGFDTWLCSDHGTVCAISRSTDVTIEGV